MSKTKPDVEPKSATRQKKSAKKSTEPKTALEKVQDKSATKPEKLVEPKATEKPSKKGPKQKEAPKAAPAPKPKRTNAKHAEVADETVLDAFKDNPVLDKKTLVSKCGGDELAVTKTLQKLRGLGKIVATGQCRSVTYRKAA